MKKLVILCNEKVSNDKDNNFYSLNADLQILPDGLNSKYDVFCIFRKLKNKANHKFILKNIKACSNIISFIYNIILTFKFKECKYLIITITPYTFLSFLVLTLFKRKNLFLYLMSSGHEEYRHILGKKSVWIYNLMFEIMTKGTKVIVCHKRLFDESKSFLVNPSRLKKNWLENHIIPDISKPKLLYVGRINPEKGILNFIKLFKKLDFDCQLSIAGNKDKFENDNKNIKKLGYISDENELINIYDKNNITILPSYTEAHPYVLEESLARKRPIIIFEEISYVKQGKFGVFISKRDEKSLGKLIKNIIKNYSDIQLEMEKNSLPTEKLMIDRFFEIIK